MTIRQKMVTKSKRSNSKITVSSPTWVVPEMARKRKPPPRTIMASASPVYILIEENDLPVVWRFDGVKPSVRIYEDGLVAAKNVILAKELGESSSIKLIKLESVVAAQDYVKSLTNEDIWYHHFPLAEGYRDTFVTCDYCGTSLEECLCEIVDADEDEDY